MSRSFRYFLTGYRDFQARQEVFTGDIMKLTTFLKHIGNDNSGATAVEYGLIVSLIVIAMIGALQSVATVSDETWTIVRERSVEAMENN